VGYWTEENSLEKRQVAYPCLESNISKCCAMKYEEKYELKSTHVHAHTHTRVYLYTSLNNKLIFVKATELYGSLLLLSGKFSIRFCTGFGVRCNLVTLAHNRTE
jgi:hypothetical protein